MSAEAYPLQWPEGWPRTEPGKRQQNSQFQVNVGKAIDELYDELGRLGAKNIVLSSNLTLNTFHRPYTKQSGISDPGIAVYFTLKGKPMVMARDAYADWRDNIRSLGLAVEAFRALHRHGGAHMMERAFSGFMALAAPAGSKRHWKEVLGVGLDGPVTAADIHVAYRQKARIAHPDMGGTEEAMTELNAAKDAAMKEISHDR